MTIVHMSDNINFEDITKIVCSRLRCRPWTWETSDVYNMVYVIARTAALRYNEQSHKSRTEGGQKPWKLRAWLIETTYSCAKVEYEREHLWANRRLQQTDRVKNHQEPFGPLPLSELVEDGDIDARLDLYAAIDRLPPKNRQILKLMCDGWPVNRIVRYLSSTATAVSNAYNDALPELKRLLT